MLVDERGYILCLFSPKKIVLHDVYNFNFNSTLTKLHFGCVQFEHLNFQKIHYSKTFVIVTKIFLPEISRCSRWSC
jgi:hypothetical protein